MNGRPAGMSDDDSDADSDYGYCNPRRRETKPINTGPKSMSEAIRTSDIAALQQSIKLGLSKKIYHCRRGSLKVGFHYIDIFAVDISLRQDDSSNDSPLLLACVTRWVDGVELLLKSGADPNVKKELVTPLAVCCNNSCSATTECVKLLIKYGADVNVKNHHGQVPIIIATLRNSTEVVKLLLKSSNIDINITDPLGRTALFYAYENGNDVLTNLLISSGINTKVRDKYSKLAEDFRPSNPYELKSPSVLVATLFESSDAQSYCRTEEQPDALDNKKIAHFLSLLPDENGSGGFSDLVPTFLEFAGLPDLPLDCNLPDLLLGDEETLTRLGVKLSQQRLRILKAAHRFHCCRWNQSSILENKNNATPSTDDIGQSIGNLLMHLVTIRCSVLYLRTRIAANTDGSGNSNALKDYVMKLVELNGTQVTMKNKLESVLEHINKMKSISDHPIDFIGSNQQKKRRSTTFKIFSATLSIISLSYFYSFVKNIFRN